MPQLRPARIASLALLMALSTTAAAEEPPSSQGLPPLDSAPANTSAWMPPRGLYLQAHVHLLSGWSLEDRAEGTTTLLELTPGAGIGLRLGYDFTQHVGAFASVEADVESEGPYAGYGAGATFTQVDATHWQVNYSGGASHDLITFSNAPTIVASDWTFT